MLPLSCRRLLFEKSPALVSEKGAAEIAAKGKGKKKKKPCAKSVPTGAARARTARAFNRINC
jgi:hypothetical protein